MGFGTGASPALGRQAKRLTHIGDVVVDALHRREVDFVERPGRADEERTGRFTVAWRVEREGGFGFALAGRRTFVPTADFAATVFCS